LPLVPGARLGGYEILSLLGQGGMGQVYRARDTKLNRDVALKLLPDAFAADADRVARFEREAHVLASLNHPNIASIYGLEDFPNPESRIPNHFLVMELVEGEDLSERIARGAARPGPEGPGIPINEALPLARQIAEGLEAAHDAGVVHRDLKPANIKVRPDGKTKILDFGLAKAVEAAATASGASGQHLSFSPTMTSPAHMTSFGVVLGTAAYMSPEQAKGRPVDKRADVWAFGAVLFEMLTGRPCFRGDDVSEMLAAILRETPDWTKLPPDTPPAIRRLLRRCLERDFRSRLSDMAMVRVELRDAETEPAVSPASGTLSAAPAKPSAFRRLLPYAAVVVAAVVTGAIVWRVRQSADVPQPPMRFSVVLPDVAQVTPSARNPVAISPDGTRLVFAANNVLNLRSLEQFDAAPVAGTAAVNRPALSPFFSPDGRWIGFWQGGQLKKVSVDGGAAVTIGDVQGNPVGLSWEADGRILVGTGVRGIMWIPATGGTLASLVPVQKDELQCCAQLLPGGDVLFVAAAGGNSTEQGQIAVWSPASGQRRVLLNGAREARYVPSGHLVYARGNTLYAQAFDAKRLALAGGPVPVLEGVANAANSTPATYYSISSAGTILYVPGTSSETALTRFVELARDGTRKPIADVPGMAWFPRFSPDGRRLAYGVSVGTDLGDPSDLWVLDVERGARTRVTFGLNNRFYPVWTRDGARLTHADGVSATNRVLLTAADGSGVSETLLDTGQRSFPSSWSPDGRVLALYTNGPTNTRDIAMLPMADGKRTSVPFVATPFEERGAIFSPDGRWIAYVSNRNGQNDIFARPYPGPGTEVTISAGGGQEPVWAPSGKELFYRHGGVLQVVRIEATATDLKVGAPSRLFDDPFRLDTGGAAGGMANYDIAPDGRRFVMIEEPRAAGTASATKLNIVVNWIDELKRRVPAK